MACKMWSYRQIPDFHNRVRMALGAVSEASLPDKYIDYPEKAPFAESVAKQRVPEWESLSESDMKIFESVVVYQTASMFESVVANKHVRKKQIPTISLEYSDKASFDINGMSLSDLVDYLVAQLNGKVVGSDFFGFRVTKGGC